MSSGQHGSDPAEGYVGRDLRAVGIEGERGGTEPVRISGWDLLAPRERGSKGLCVGRRHDYATQKREYEKQSLFHSKSSLIQIDAAQPSNICARSRRACQTPGNGSVS